MRNSSFEKVALALVLPLMCLSCASANNATRPPDDCSRCTTLGLNCVDNQCVPPCASAADCGAGHACVGQECDPQCDSTLCPTGQACSSATGVCEAVGCTATVPCSNSGDFCDASQQECFPLDGQCLGGWRCPTSPNASVSIDCDSNNLCRASQPADTIAFADAPQGVQVLLPHAGDELTDVRKLLVQWKQTTAPVIALLLDSLPTAAADVPAHTLWAASRRADQTPQLIWTDGHRVDSSGAWHPLPSDFAPTGYFYVVLQALDSGALVALSPPIPIAAGVHFPVPGTPCATPPGTGSDCHTPLRPQTCWQGTCRAICGSDADCPGKSCEPPNQGYRLCAL